VNFRSKKLRQKVAMGFICVSIFGTNIICSPANVFAAPSTGVVAAEMAESAANPNDFAAKIQRIIDEHHRSKEYQRQSRWEKLHSREKEITSPPNMQDSEIVTSDNNAPVPVMPNQHIATEGRYNFDWQGTPLAQSIYAVAKIANKDVVVNGGLEGTVFMSLHNVTCEQAMQRLSSAYNFNWMTDENAIIVSTSELMLQSKVFNVHHAYDMEKLTKEIHALGIQEDKIYANTEQRTVSVTGTPYQLKQAERRLQVIDKPISQCLILAQLIQVNHGKNNNLGFQYSLPTYSHEANTSGDTDTLRGNFLEKLTFSASATASRSLSNGKVIARPMVLMMNGQEGMVNFGEQVPVMSSTTTTASTQITVDYKDIGTKLTITPAIDEANNQVTMKINAEVSTITSWHTTNQTSAPQISTRQATTSAHLRSGQSFVIGGLMSVQELDNLSGIPGLMNLPILGQLFKYHSRSKEYTEVFIMITPYIVSDDIDPKAILRQAGEDNG